MTSDKNKRTTSLAYKWMYWTHTVPWSDRKECIDRKDIPVGYCLDPCSVARSPDDLKWNLWPFNIGYGFIKCPQLDFSKRKITLHRIQGHGLINRVIRYIALKKK